MPARKRHILMAAVTLTLGGIAAGCSNHPRIDGMPRQATLIGGGNAVRFIAPTTGMLYIVDARDGKLLASTAMKAGEDESFMPGEEAMESLTKMKYGEKAAPEMALKPADLRFYFASFDALGMNGAPAGGRRAGGCPGCARSKESASKE